MTEAVEVTDEELSRAISDIANDILDMVLDKYSESDVSPSYVTLGTFYAAKRMTEALGSKAIAMNLAQAMLELAVELDDKPADS